MVLIELNDTEDNHSNPPFASASSETPGIAKMVCPDGFETASDGDLGDTGDDNEEEVNQKLWKEEQETEVSNQDELMQNQETTSRSGSNSTVVLKSIKIRNSGSSSLKAFARASEAKLEGNKLFGQAKYEEAKLQYEVALQTAPCLPSSVELRSICHANCGLCYVKQGKYEETIKECTKALELNPTYLKALIRRGEAHENLEHFEEAIADMKKTLELDSSNEHAKKSICRLEPLAEQKREKMKEEMIGKLKEMGNSLLGRFGISLDNFKAVKDPNTGSYSVSYQQ